MIVVGEKINGTIEEVKKALLQRDRDYIAGLAAAQAQAGADYIDVNAGTGASSEKEDLRWAATVAFEETGLPLALDSSDPAILSEVLTGFEGVDLLVNSVNGEEERLEAILPAVRDRGCKVVALAMDGEGIPDDSPGRLRICGRIAERARGLGIPEEDLFIDPLVMPVSADSRQGMVTVETLAGIKKQVPGCRTILGLSNVSFGLPARSAVNRALLVTATFMGLDAAIMDPTDVALMSAVLAAEAASGRDAYCRVYTRAYREGKIV